MLIFNECLFITLGWVKPLMSAFPTACLYRTAWESPVEISTQVRAHSHSSLRRLGLHEVCLTNGTGRPVYLPIVHPCVDVISKNRHHLFMKPAESEYITRMPEALITSKIHSTEFDFLSAFFSRNFVLTQILPHFFE